MKNIFLYVLLLVSPFVANAQCHIYDLVATPSDCVNGQFFVTIDFQYVGTGDQGFKMQGGGNQYGSFDYDDLPITLGPFTSSSTTTLEFVARDIQYPTCQDFDLVGPINCDPAPCEISDLVATPGECNLDGTYSLEIDFQVANAPHTHFDLLYQGQNIGYYAIADLPITIPHFDDNGEPGQVIKVCINDSDCCAEDEFQAPDCDGLDCSVSDFVASPGDCNPDGTYPLTIDFQVENPPHTHFDLIYGGQNIGYYTIADLPITIPHFNDNGEPNQVIKVCINDSDCCAEDEFHAPDCDPDTGDDCHIFDVFAEAYPCNSSGQYMLDVQFSSQNTGSEGFKIRAGSLWFGPFAYGQPFYTIGPLNAGVVYEIVVRDEEYEDCRDVFVFGPVNCGGDCNIFDLTASVSDCNDQGQFFVTLDFQHENTGDDGFKIYGNGNVYGYFSYDDLPVTIGPLTSDDEQLEFGAADVSHPTCHDFAVVQIPDCGEPNGGGDCHIFDMVADVHPCLPNGTFYVTLDFQHEGTGGYFKVKGNGTTYGIYSYDDLPVEIGPLLGNGTTSYEFAAIDLFNEACHDYVNIGTINCNGSGDCEVHNLIIDPSECNPDDSYNLWFWFEFDNPGSNHYQVHHNGEFIGNYSLAQVPLTLSHLFANDQTLQTLKVCVSDNPNCCVEIHYEAPSCDGIVWPGDANRDHICNHFDLLNIGLAYHWQGSARTVQGIEWTGLTSTNWSNLFDNGVNAKNADCNGNGLVDASDVAAVALNFGETAGAPQPMAFLEGSAHDPPLFVDMPASSGLQSGMTFTAPVMLGIADMPVNDIYGLAFTLKFDPEVISPVGFSVNYAPSWLGAQLTFHRPGSVPGEVQVSLVRTDHNNVSGFGQVAGIIGIIDNIAGKESTSIEIVDVKAIRKNEELISLRTPVEVVDLDLDDGHGPAVTEMHVFPNPAKNEVFFTLPNDAQPDVVELRSLEGRLLLSTGSGKNSLNLSSLGKGMYILKVRSGDRVYQQRIVN